MKLNEILKKNDRQPGDPQTASHDWTLHKRHGLQNRTSQTAFTGFPMGIRGKDSLPPSLMSQLDSCVFQTALSVFFQEASVNQGIPLHQRHPAGPSPVRPNFLKFHFFPLY